jgi:DNA-binding FadR family transcriptional regulator
VADKRTSETPRTPDSNHRPTQFHAERAPRLRIADRVFETLLRAILQGELRPGEAVPTQRELSTQFGVSPLVVRQAIHRLEELELVRVRQGSTTVVLDPTKATDVRLIQLQLEVARPGDAIALAAIENRALSALPLLALAERRITEAELQRLERRVEAYSDEPSREEQSVFMAEFWEMIAGATRNPLLQHQVRWWFRVSNELGANRSMRTARLPRAFFRELAGALRKRSGAVQLWLAVVVRLCDWTEVQPGHTMHAERRRSPKRARAAQ